MSDSWVVVRLAGAYPPAGAAQLIASLAMATNRSEVGSEICGTRELRAKSTVRLVVEFRAMTPALLRSGRPIVSAPVLGVICRFPVESQLYSRGEVVSPAAVSAAL